MCPQNVEFQAHAMYHCIELQVTNLVLCAVLRPFYSKSFTNVPLPLKIFRKV